LILPLTLFAGSLPAQVVISQVYGGGGNAGSTFKNDFIEVFNRGVSAVSLNGWSVQYASAAGTTWQVTNLTNTMLQPGQYYLVQESQGAGGTTNLPTPDATGTIAMSATVGKVALVNSTTALSGSCPSSASIQDLIGYGTGTGGASCFEGTTAAPTLTNTTADLRAAAGCTDNNTNSTDFSSGAPNPRNTATATNLCGGATPITITNASPLTAGTVNQPYSVTFTATGGTGSGYTFSQFSGTFPPGLTLTGATLSGMPNTTAGSPFSFTIQVTDSGSNTAQKTFSLTINAAPTCTPTHTIAQIQGNGNTSPLVGNTETTSGIVTGLKSNGFFIQMPSPGDGDSSTSDGVFVFTSSAPPAAVLLGNSICVTGNVQEFIPSTDPNSPSQTELASATNIFAISTGNPLPPAVVLTTADTDPNGGIFQLEKYEGMRVQVNAMTVVAPTQGNVDEVNATGTSNGIFYGVITGIARPFREPGVQQPDPLPAGSPCCVTRWDANPELIGVNSLGLTGSAAIDVAFGATLTNVVGPLEVFRRYYTINTDVASPPTVSNNTQTFIAVPVPTAAELTIASFNMQRFFDTTDDPGISDVALTPTAFNNRLNKASLAIRNVLHYPDIIGVEEMENITTLQAVATKVNNDSVTAGDPNPNYQAYLVEGNDIGGIDVGLLVKTPKVNVIDVTQYGKTTTYIDPGNNQPAILNDRPPLVLRATVTRAGSDSSLPFTLIVNHLRSLSGIDDAVDGNRVRVKREAQAEYLANLIQGFQNADPNLNLISIGDYNAFQFSDGYADVVGVVKGTPVPANEVVVPPMTITNPPLTDLIDTAPADQRYSYSFSGTAQEIDHMLVNPSMAARLSRYAVARNNADFPEVYRTNPNRPERISDHDMPVAYFTLPLTHTITVNTSPLTGPSFIVDNNTYTSQQMFQWEEGSTHSLSTTSPQTSNDTQFVFNHWSDMGATTHMLMAPTMQTTYTSFFDVLYRLNISASPSGGGTVSPATGTFYTASSMVNISATPNNGYQFVNWTGDPVANPNSAATTITMDAGHAVQANFSALPTSMGANSTGKSGPLNARVWSFTVTNAGPGVANTALMSTFTLAQSGGPACSSAPVVSSASVNGGNNQTFPNVQLGNMAPASSIPVNVTIDFSTCSTASRFTLTIGLSANAGSTTASVSKSNQFP
jgi:predicted extracellular nuclease